VWGEIFSQIKEYIQGINPFVMYIILFFLGLYIFWRGCIETRKNRSSVFDIYVLSAVISVAIGENLYIILAWDSVFSSYIMVLASI
jgi:cation transport ATPase